MILGSTAGVLPGWLGCTGTFSEHPTGTWSQSQGHYSSYRVGYSGGFLASDRMPSISSDGRWLLGSEGTPVPDQARPAYAPRCTFVCRPYMTPEVAFIADRDIWREENRRLWTSVCTLIYFGTIEWHQFDEVQNYPHRPLNIDWLHARDGRGDYLRWWYLAARRFLAPDDAFYPRPPDEIPPEAIQRVADTSAGGTQVDDVPDNRRPDRRRMVGTRTTNRDWQWLDEMIRDEAAVLLYEFRLHIGIIRSQGLSDMRIVFWHSLKGRQGYRPRYYSIGFWHPKPTVVP
ncbi:hypothetical protein PIB30_063955 [Stylosanthes scabra]|uniref:Uncharacterized protein n=1 Tax=Stylosanthes scabra TaxID=79078 RepID=A0ABU6VNH6_9FABA|nr:hypothetical protein [Stylosanthes scabra]